MLGIKNSKNGSTQMHS